MKNTDKLIKSEIERLTGILNGLTDDQLTVADNLIREAAFMKIALQGLKDEINKDGPVEMFTQGPNSYKRQHPALSGYNALVKNYTVVIKQLIDMIPEANTSKVGEALAKFNAEIE
ncbi:hypothetical protein EG832_02965 [bacterium]|nr:hypothetical protein [bacterium]